MGSCLEYGVYLFQSDEKLKRITMKNRNGNVSQGNFNIKMN